MRGWAVDRLVRAPYSRHRKQVYVRSIEAGAHELSSSDTLIGCFLSRAYRSAHALTPPAFFMNVFNRAPGAFQRATYRNARAHLLIVLLSAFSAVQRMTTVNGSAFLSRGSPANWNACRRSFLVFRRTL